MPPLSVRFGTHHGDGLAENEGEMLVEADLLGVTEGVGDRDVEGVTLEVAEGEGTCMQVPFIAAMV